jgi:GTPase SAR1 family protein
VKLLLLGAGESGKSTLFKQIMQIHGKGLTAAEREPYRPIIHNNIIASIHTLLEQSDKLNSYSVKSHNIPTLTSPDINDVKLVFAAMRSNETSENKTSSPLSPEHGPMIRKLWADPGIQQTYALRSRYQLTDGAAYFFNKIDDIVAENYHPSVDDVLRARVRTTGIVDNHFAVDGVEFKIFDVGGQRSERKKWIHCFENVTALLFVAALNEYDMVVRPPNKICSVFFVWLL